MIRASLPTLFAMVLAPALAFAGAADEKLGEEYTKASASQKLVMISVAKTDKVLDYKEVNAAVAEVALAHVKPGETSEERLKLLGALRKEAKESLKAVNTERRAKDKKARRASLTEPSSNFQLAVALAYVSNTAGPKPSLEALGCLALVRESTAWSSTGTLVLAFAQEAFARDEAFMKGDLTGKLSMIKKTAEERQMLSDFERKPLENAVLANWMSTQLKAGKSATDIKAELKTLKDKKLICFFSSSWAKGILDALAGL